VVNGKVEVKKGKKAKNPEILPFLPFLLPVDKFAIV